MSGMPRVDTAVAAAGVVGMADEIMKAIHDNRKHHPDDATGHYVKAAIAGAIAIGAFALLKKDEDLGNDVASDDTSDGHNKSGHEGNGGDNHSKSHRSETHKRHHGSHSVHGHTVDLVSEAAGAYALGRQMLGHKEHHILKLVAEGLGAASTVREANHV